MKLLDRYILKKFLTTYVFVVAVLMAVIVVIDFTEKNDDFIKNEVSVREILLDYYLNLIPYYANFLSPITIFIATVFVTAQLALRTEIIAMLSSGVSFVRLLLPYFVGSLLIGLISFGLIGWVIPKANEIRVAFEVQYLKRPYYFDGQNIHQRIGPQTYAYLRSYNNSVRTGYQFTLEDVEGTDLRHKLTAQRIVWQPEQEKWRIEKYRLHTFRDTLETVTFGETLDTLINLYPRDFESQHGRHETMTLPELRSFIREQRDRGAEDVERYEVERAERLNYPFAAVILTLIGVIMSARKSRKGAGLQIALGFVLAFVYILFVITSRKIAQAGGVDPLLAASTPNMVFAAIGLILYRTVPR